MTDETYAIELYKFSGNDLVDFKSTKNQLPINYEIKTFESKGTSNEYIGLSFNNWDGSHNTCNYKTENLDPAYYNYRLSAPENQTNLVPNFWSNYIKITPLQTTTLYFTLIGAAGGGGGAGFQANTNCTVKKHYGGAGSGGGSGATTTGTVTLLSGQTYHIYLLIPFGTEGGYHRNVKDGSGSGGSAQNVNLPTQMLITNLIKSADNIYISSNGGGGGIGGQGNGDVQENVGFGGKCTSKNPVDKNPFDIINTNASVVLYYPGMNGGKGEAGPAVASGVCKAYFDGPYYGDDNPLKIENPFYNNYAGGGGSGGNRTTTHPKGGNFSGGDGGACTQNGSEANGRNSNYIGGGGGGGCAVNASIAGGNGGNANSGLAILYVLSNDIKINNTPINIDYTHESLKDPFMRGNPYKITNYANQKFYLVGRSQNSQNYYYLTYYKDSLIFISEEYETVKDILVQVNITQTITPSYIFKLQAYFKNDNYKTPYPISKETSVLTSYPGNINEVASLSYNYSKCLGNSPSPFIYPGVWYKTYINPPTTTSKGTQVLWYYSKCLKTSDIFCNGSDSSKTTSSFDIMLIPVNNSSNYLSKWSSGICTTESGSEALGLEWFNNWIKGTGDSVNCSGSKSLTSESNNCYFSNNSNCNYKYLYSINENTTTCAKDLGICSTTNPTISCVYSNTDIMVCLGDTGQPDDPVDPDDSGGTCNDSDSNNTIFIVICILIVIIVIILIIYMVIKKKKDTPNSTTY